MEISQHPVGSGRIYAVTGRYDIDLQSSGSGGWVGAFGKSVLGTAVDILDDGPFGPVEVSYTTGSGLRTFVGILLGVDPAAGTLTVEPYPTVVPGKETDLASVAIAVGDVVRFRA